MLEEILLCSTLLLIIIAILANPSTYEIIDPEIFGRKSCQIFLTLSPEAHSITVTRYVSINSRITGWNAVKSRVEQLGLKMTDEQVSFLIFYF